MIVAVPEQHRDLVTLVSSVRQIPPTLGTFTWWHWACTVCWAVSKPHALFSHAPAAIEMGEYHERREQCDVIGQLALFGALAGAR